MQHSGGAKGIISFRQMEIDFKQLIYSIFLYAALRHSGLQAVPSLAKVQPTRARFNAARAWAEP
jgi:hypothetical protein